MLRNSRRGHPDLQYHHTHHCLPWEWIADIPGSLRPAMDYCKKYLPSSIASPDAPKFDLTFLERRPKPAFRSDDEDETEPKSSGELGDQGSNMFDFAKLTGTRVMKAITSAKKTNSVKPVGAFGNIGRFSSPILP